MGLSWNLAKCRYHHLKSCQFSSPLSLFCDMSVADQLVKNPPGMQETLVRFLGREDPLKKGKATYSSNLAWRIAWTV